MVKAPVKAQIRHLQVSATVGMIVLLPFLIPPRPAGVADAVAEPLLCRPSTTSCWSS